MIRVERQVLSSCRVQQGSTTNLKRKTQPYISNIIPTIGHLTKMKNRPRRNDAEPCKRGKERYLSPYRMLHYPFMKNSENLYQGG